MFKRLCYILFFLFFVSIPCVHAQLNTEHWLDQGKRKINVGDYAAAIENFNTILMFNPEFEDALFLRAVSKYNLGDYRGAINDFTKVISLHSNHSDYYLYRGSAQGKILNLNDAMEDYNRAIELKPRNTDAYLNRGITEVIMKKYDDAIYDFNIAIEYDKDIANAYLYRAIAKQCKNVYEGAMMDFNRAIALNPWDAEAYIRRGRNLCEMKDFKAAIADFDTALTFDKKSSFAFFNRALTKYEMGDHPGALKDFDKVLKLDPNNALTYYYRAELRAEMGDYSWAIEDFNEVVRINPRNVLAYFNRAIAWCNLNNYHKAIFDYSKAIELNPFFAKAYYNRSIARRNINDNVGATNDYKKAIEINSSLSNLSHTQLMDSTGLARMMEFKADFTDSDDPKEKNVEGNFLIPSFSVSIIKKEMQKKYSSAYSKKMEELNKISSRKNIFILTTQNDTISKDSIEQQINLQGFIANTSDQYLKLFSRAILHHKSQNYGKALADYNQVIHLKPDFALAYFNRANARFAMEFYLNSNNDYNSDIIYIDDSQKNNVSVAKTIFYYDDVMADFNKCIQIDPEFYYAYFNMANVKIESKDYLGALNDYARAIEIEPKFAEAYYNRGLTYIHIHEVEEGCLNLSKAGELGLPKAYAAIKEYCNF